MLHDGGRVVLERVGAAFALCDEEVGGLVYPLLQALGVLVDVVRQFLRHARKPLIVVYRVPQLVLRREEAAVELVVVVDLREDRLECVAATERAGVARCVGDGSG